MTESESLETKLLHDLHTGMTDNALMEKYRLSYAQLRSLYKDLFDAGLLKPQHGSLMMSVRNSKGARPGSRLPGSGPSRGMIRAEGGDEQREADRCDLDFHMPIYEIGRPEVHGRVVDITERGARLSGVRAEVGQSLTLVALGDTLGDIAPFEFRALCKWNDHGVYDGDGVGGFEITEISDESLGELRKLIQSIDLGI
ncbi:MAG: hypothetical protein RDU20_20445 [Desulfomonilaceae bacterium]|nr:hypothetical protein [Desulfomonilaceae bacterium]